MGIGVAKAVIIGTKGSQENSPFFSRNGKNQFKNLLITFLTLRCESVLKYVINSDMTLKRI